MSAAAQEHMVGILTWWLGPEDLPKSQYNLSGPVPSHLSTSYHCQRSPVSRNSTSSSWGPSVQTWEPAERPFTFKPQHTPSISPHLSREGALPAYTGCKASVNASYRSRRSQQGRWSGVVLETSLGYTGRCCLRGCLRGW